MEQQEWTIMIYMAGDNNLSVDMAYAMQQIKEVAGEDTENVNLFVYYDGYSASIPTLYCDFSDSNNPKHTRSFMVQDKIFPVDLKTDENAADYRSVVNFVDWCVNKVPHRTDDGVAHGRRANRYALIFSGHSMGFQDIGLFRDETSEQALDMDKLNWLLERITKSKEELIAEAVDPEADDYENATTEILGQKLDILGFDSCVMSMLEVGHQFNTVAKTMIASEGSVPSAGWTYAKILGSLAHDSNGIPVNDIAAKFVSEFVRSQDSYTIGGVSVDMAAWDLSKLGGLNGALATLAEYLSECFEDPTSTIYRQMERVLLQVHWKCQSYMFEQNVDLGDFCELLRAECASLRNEVGGDSDLLFEKIERGCTGVLSELTNSVILSGFSGGMYQYSNGISLFFPWSLAAYEVSRENYESLLFVQETAAGKAWNSLLDMYLSEVTLRRAPEPTRKGSEPSAIVLESALPAQSGAAVSAYGMPDTKLRYYSYEYKDVLFENGEDLIPESETKIAGVSGTKIAGVSGSKIAGVSGTKGAGEDTKIAGVSGSKIAGVSGTKGEGDDTKIAGVSGTKIAGVSGTKGAGEDTKIAGVSGTKIAGVSGTKIAGVSGTKIAGVSGTKIAGVSGTKIAGVSGTKIAGGGGTSAFFESFKHFKNIEAPWNISGFTKQPPESDSDEKASSTAG